MIWDVVVEEIENHKDKNRSEDTDNLSVYLFFMSVIIPSGTDATADRADSPENNAY